MLGWPARFAGSAFGICSSLYAARVFSVFESSSRSTTPRSSTRRSRGSSRTCASCCRSRLGLGGETDHLRVAAALEVEDAVVAPAVLVVADQRARRDPRRASSCRCRKGRRRSRRRRAWPTFAEQCIGKHALERQQVVHHGEDRLLDLARVEGAADQHLVREGWSTTNVPVRVPSASGSASTSGAWRTRACGSNSRELLRSGR